MIGSSVDKYDVFSPSVRANPQAVYERIRREDPVYCATGPMTGNAFWILTRCSKTRVSGWIFGNTYRPKSANAIQRRLMRFRRSTAIC